MNAFQYRRNASNGSIWGDIVDGSLRFSAAEAGDIDFTRSDLCFQTEVRRKSDWIDFVVGTQMLTVKWNQSIFVTFSLFDHRRNCFWSRSSRKDIMIKHSWHPSVFAGVVNCSASYFVVFHCRWLCLRLCLVCYTALLPLLAIGLSNAFFLFLIG